MLIRPSHSAPGRRAASGMDIGGHRLVRFPVRGVLGLALAMPLFAIGRVAVLRLYVEDWLEGDLK